MNLNNIIATYGHLSVTEEVNCYVVWDTTVGIGISVHPFKESKDEAYARAKQSASASI